MSSNAFPEPNARLEMHTHSTVSDGVHSPTFLAELCAHKGVGLWSLTDHDTCGGCEEAWSACREQGVTFVPGIEISAQARGRSIHVLGYGFDPESAPIRAYAKRLEQGRLERMAAMIERVNGLGFGVTLDEVLKESERGNVGRPHLARVMQRSGYVETTQEAFDLYLADDRPAYVPMKWFEVEEAIELIAQAGGFTVLAHPARYEHLDSNVARWKSMGLSGLEVRHPSHGLADEERLVRLANQNGLLKTASSDFHGGGREGDEALVA
ncbi:MAG: PHP domain-containing protein [Bradymonadaceae bacterium]